MVCVNEKRGPLAGSDAARRLNSRDALIHGAAPELALAEPVRLVAVVDETPRLLVQSGLAGRACG